MSTEIKRIAMTYAGQVLDGNMRANAYMQAHGAISEDVIDWVDENGLRLPPPPYPTLADLIPLPGFEPVVAEPAFA